jgi:hypothetical protein
MTPPDDFQNASESENRRADYVPPRLTTLGNVHELTQLMAAGGGDMLGGGWSNNGGPTGMSVVS